MKIIFLDMVGVLNCRQKNPKDKSVIDRKFVIKTNRRDGLTRKDAEKAISILNGE